MHPRWVLCYDELYSHPSALSFSLCHLTLKYAVDVESYAIYSWQLVVLSRCSACYSRFRDLLQMLQNSLHAKRHTALIMRSWSKAGTQWCHSPTFLPTINSHFWNASWNSEAHNWGTGSNAASRLSDWLPGSRRVVGGLLWALTHICRCWYDMVISAHMSPGSGFSRPYGQTLLTVFLWLMLFSRWVLWRGTPLPH